MLYLTTVNKILSHCHSWLARQLIVFLYLQRPEEGSTNSLQDSGISEHEGGATGGNSPLSKLPGPGKFKQMTGRREHDTDSGFIGSLVGSEVSAGNLSSRRQPPQSPLRLRHPEDVPGNQR